MTALGVASVTIPLYTKIGEGDYVHLGDATIDVPFDLHTVQEALPMPEIEAALTGAATPPPTADASMLDGPHSRACGITPHQHGTRCHSNCPTCHGKKEAPVRQSQTAEGGVSLPVGDVPAPGPAAPEVADE